MENKTQKRQAEHMDGRHQVIKSIHERIVFAVQNITADPPFSRLDLIICRNLLIYLDQQIQKKIIALFHFALRDGGFLFLGNAETVGDREDLFDPVSKKWRIYRRIGVGHRVNVEIPACSAAQPAQYKPPASVVTPRPSLTSIAQQALLTRFAPACVMIDRKLQVLYVHGLIENYLTIPAGELTTRVVDMAREGLRVRLRGAIAKCIETGRLVAFTARTRRGEKSVPVKATVSPLRHLRETDGLLLITFEDQRIPVAVKSGRAAGAEDDVRQLADELKITREELQSTIDQLEGSNDQLKASNEEVMAANEELQSANEEMETSKEELQSLNEELNTINIRLQEKVDELESTNNDVVNLLASASIATLFLDKGFRIKRFTPAITGLMSLIPTDLGRPIGDILMRFTDEEAVEAERQRLYNVLELLPAYVVLLTPDYHVTFANRFFRERFGEAQGKRCYEFLFQRTEPCEICETYTVLKTGKPHHWEWTGPDGRNYDVHDFPFTDSDGAPFILEMGIDITEIKSAEAALKEANETLERRVAERTAEVEGFSYSVSHDLRAPLRAIDGYSRMILRKHADRFDDDALGKFNVIRDNTRMMGQLIDDLLAFSRLGRAQLSKVMLDIGELIREIWEELKAINPDRRLTLKIAEIPPCRGDRGLIKQVLVNILSNAVKFTRGREEALIEAGGYNKDGEIVYYVRGNGVGFDMQYHDKMFGVFQRLHSADEFEGTGVGLAIVQRIIHRHGGRIWAEGKIDRGACFYFSLPA